MTTSKEWSWGDLSQTIADRTKRKAYSLDARNHGGSGWSEDFSFDLNVEDLLHFMDEVCIPKAVIVGHSMGAYTGYRVAVKAPERIAMLFAEEMFVAKVPQAVTDIFLDLPKLWIEVEDFIPPGLEIEEAENFITEYVRSKNPSLVPPKNGRHDPLGLCHLLKKNPSGRVAFRANLKVIQKNASNIGSIMSEPAGVYEGPTYIIYGSKSPFEIHKHKESIRKHFPKAVFLEFGRAGHFVHKKCPKEYTEKVVKHILENEK
ncbi:abhydrolase domain-containing protein 11 [Caerostris extrusa]|uniref:sn-1-specific diacylglycerol lipase ABHD11 n=1 Tax=Caerostris extrusa TaxID=172846 RepID=A0AAV4TKZ0_CAEEX|nr:abhydrolase domain-containing protein 11 [Caerostris extrusa]